MSDEIETREVQGGCRPRSSRSVDCGPCNQGYYQDWRAAQTSNAPDSRICKPFGQPQIYGAGSAGADGSNTGVYWDNARSSENQNQTQYWGAKQDGNIVRTASGKVIDIDYGNGNWAHSPHDSNSVTVHRQNRTEHWVPQSDGRWYDQINSRFLPQSAVRYDAQSGKLVIEGETFDPKGSQPGLPDVPLPAPEADPKPSGNSDSPVTPKPPDATPTPPDATPKPPDATPKPPEAEPKPSGHSDSAVTPKPPDATPKPPDATPKPPDATPKPPEADPKPPANSDSPVTPQPSDATPKPSDATPKPPEVAPLPRAVKPSELLTQELAASPFDVEHIHKLIEGIPARERIKLVAETTKEADAALAKAPDDAAAKALSARAHAVMGRELIPEMLTSKWNSAQLKSVMEGMVPAERFTFMNDAIKFSDATRQDDQVGAALRGSMAFMCADLAREYEAQKASASPERQAKLHELAGQTKWRAIEWAMAAGHMDPKLYADDSTFRQGILNAGLPGQSAEFIVQKGKENANWFFPTQEQIAASRNAFQDSYDSARQQISEAMKRPKAAAPDMGPATQTLEPRRGILRRLRRR